MAITSSAKKEIRASKRRYVYNVRRLRTMRQTIKTTNDSTMDAGGKSQSVKAAQKAIDKAEKSGVIKKNTASRKKAQLMRKGAKSIQS